MAWTLTTSGSAIAKAGLSVSTVSANMSGSILETWSNEAESLIAANTRVDIVDDFANLEANGKELLANIASNMIAQKIVIYNRDEYGSMREKETILDVIENDIRRGLALIEEDKIKTYLKIT